MRSCGHHRCSGGRHSLPGQASRLHPYHDQCFMVPAKSRSRGTTILGRRGAGLHARTNWPSRRRCRFRIRRHELSRLVAPQVEWSDLIAGQKFNLRLYPRRGQLGARSADQNGYANVPARPPQMPKLWFRTPSCNVIGNSSFVMLPRRVST